MELSNQFTKEQLIAKAQEQIEFIRRTQVTGAGREHVDMCGELFEIALASLTAEAVAWTDEQELRDVEKGGCGYLFTVNRAGTVTGISVFHVFFHMVWRVYA
ncbi:hypothetical protein AC294_004070 [Salmonella enterica subsp. enterica]|nr:hypothetical protein [Salmonella enterica subsp. enterica]EAM9331763.1 hypothetical protein [Salmonella enterica]EBS0704197.1 hypothetical protein [Salmonella enterica subsp. enterica serovar Brunei]EAS1966495.1 hypothetical protein [Salmonella enterica]EAX1862077.1 hypothetical protein [Salmonella enterica]